jgi:hypothetical protein
MTLATHIRYLEVVEMKVLLSLCQIIAEVTLDLRPLNVAQHMMDQVMCDGLSQTNIVAGHPPIRTPFNVFVEWAVSSCG